MPANRLQRLRAALEDKNLDAILISTPENRQYLSGFVGTAGWLFISRERAILATDFRYTEQAGKQAPNFEVLQVGGWNWLVEQLEEIGPARVGFESQHVTMAAYRRIVAAIKDMPEDKRPTLVATSNLIENIRAVKDAQELVLLQNVIDISDKAMETVTPTLKAGQTEREIAWLLEKAMREFGADSLSFDTIVAGGPNGAMPHHRAGDRPVQEGEPIVIDMGAKLDGYCSDITRTICIGQHDDQFRKIYNLVLGAQLTAISTLKPSLNGEEADNLARTVLDEAGFQKNFGHSLGHGIGLAVHEFPRVGPTSPDVLEESMVFSVEPGIYLSGWGGVRIEDLVVLEEAGARPLSKARK